MSTRLIHDMPDEDQPSYRLQNNGPSQLSLTNLIALVINDHRKALTLIDQYGYDIHHLSRITVPELCASGLTQIQAQRLLAAVWLGIRINEPRPARDKFYNPEGAAAVLQKVLWNKEKEELWVLVLDTRNGVITKEQIYVGSINTSVVRIGELFKPAVRVNGCGIIIGHNHPSGDSNPSPEDIHVTHKCVEAGELLNINVIDHIIIGDGNFTSLKEKGVM